MKRVLAAIDTTHFWVAVFLLALGSVFLYAYSANRADVIRNSELIVEQRRALGYLCETVRVLDAITVQSIAIDRLFARDLALAPSVRATVSRRLNLWRQAHREFSDTRACRQIE